MKTLIIKSWTIWKPRYWVINLLNRFEIYRRFDGCREYCRDACQGSEWSHNSEEKCRGFELLQNLIMKRFICLWVFIVFAVSHHNNVTSCDVIGTDRAIYYMPRGITCVDTPFVHKVPYQTQTHDINYSQMCEGIFEELASYAYHVRLDLVISH